MLLRLRQADFSVRVFKTADGVGETWYWNRYSGCRFDVESMQNLCSFSDALSRTEASLDAEGAWVARHREVGNRSLGLQCGSWYVGTNIPGKPRVFPANIGGFPVYTQKIESVAVNGYDGFTFEWIT